MAGAEHQGPEHGRADLFRGRPWVLTPAPWTSPEAVRTAAALAQLCGARVLLRSPADHDRGVAAVSQLPQLVASALAARLAELPDSDIELAGQGLRDMVRIAGSAPGFWEPLLRANARELATVLDGLLDDLHAVRAALDRLAGQSGSRSATADTEPITDLIRRGNKGRARLPS